MWTVTLGQSCELCPIVTMAMRDPPQGSSCAVRSPKAKDVPLNSAILAPPQPLLRLNFKVPSFIFISFLPFPPHLISCVLLVFLSITRHYIKEYKSLPHSTLSIINGLPLHWKKSISDLNKSAQLN